MTEPVAWQIRGTDRRDGAVIEDGPDVRADGLAFLARHLDLGD